MKKEDDEIYLEIEKLMGLSQSFQVKERNSTWYIICAR